MIWASEDNGDGRLVFRNQNGEDTEVGEINFEQNTPVFYADPKHGFTQRELEAIANFLRTFA